MECTRTFPRNSNIHKKCSSRQLRGIDYFNNFVHLVRFLVTVILGCLKDKVTLMTKIAVIMSRWIPTILVLYYAHSYFGRQGPVQSEVGTAEPNGSFKSFFMSEKEER